MLGEISQKQNNKYHTFPFICEIGLKNSSLESRIVITTDWESEEGSWVWLMHLVMCVCKYHTEPH
jgi:hypothetical protein